MTKYIYKSALDLAGLIKEGRATSVDVVQEHLDQIKKYNQELNAIVILTEEQALATAAECDREAKEGNFRGPLHGVPLTIKEQYWIGGLKPTESTIPGHGNAPLPEGATGEPYSTWLRQGLWPEPSTI